MDFRLSEEQQAIRSAVRDLCKRYPGGYWRDLDQRRAYPEAFVQELTRGGWLAALIPKEYGGAGLGVTEASIILEEINHSGGNAAACHAQMYIMGALLRHGSEAQKQRFLPGIADGSLRLQAFGVTEPNAGSDTTRIQTMAVRQGDHYVVNGQKTFITNGILSDLVVAVVKTNPALGHKGISLLIVERGMEGFQRGRLLEKVGLKAQDTAELIFEDVQVPVNNLLGEEGQGFYYLMRQLARERLNVAVGAMAACETALEITLDYCKQRTAFGKPIGSFQNSRFKLAEMKTEIEIGRVFTDRCIEELLAGTLTPETAAMAKWWTSDLQKRVVDECVQLHGGYGYMLEYPIARAYVDARVQSIYAGTNEIMKEIIGRSLGV